MVGTAEAGLWAGAELALHADLPYRDGTVEVQFDDWMYLQPGG